MNFQGYGLRDNPKKSWKSLDFADDDTDAGAGTGTGTGTTSSLLKFECKACDKEFESRKALFGHMRHHSGSKRKFNCQECGRKFQSLKAVTNHMRFHSVKLRVPGESGSGGLRQELVLESITVKRKRSKRMRYNNAPNSSLSSLNESSGLVEIDREVEEAALCLVMLSRGVRNWSEFISFGESGDNNSEINSLHQKIQTPFLDADEAFQLKKRRVDKSDSDASASMNVFYEKDISKCKELDSGFVTDMEKKVGPEAPNDILCRSAEFKVLKVDDESGFELYNTEIEDRVSGEIMTFNSIEVETGQDLMEGSDLAALGSIKSSSCKEAIMFDAYDAEQEGDSLNKLISTPLDSEMFDDSQKKKIFKCRICCKTFKSHQALGGHQTIHRKGNISATDQIENCGKITQSSSFPEIEASHKVVKVEYVDNSVEQELNGVASYGTSVYKLYKCQICLKVFASGQALGGHKRSHMSKDSGIDDKQPANQLEFSDITDVIDLNFPSMQNEEANGDIGFKSCRVGSDSKNEALVSLVAR